MKNTAIDNTHKEAAGMINRIARLIESGVVAALPEAFKLLEEGLCAYFAIEKNIAQAVGFDFTEYSAAHQELLNDFQRIKNWLLEKNGMWTKFEEKGCIDSLKNCMVRHIKEDGKPLKVVLKKDRDSIRSSQSINDRCTPVNANFLC